MLGLVIHEEESGEGVGSSGWLVEGLGAGLGLFEASWGREEGQWRSRLDGSGLDAEGGRGSSVRGIGV